MLIMTYFKTILPLRLFSIENSDFRFKLIKKILRVNFNFELANPSSLICCFLISAHLIYK